MAIRMLLADVDGTLVTQDKVLTDRAIAAVGKLKQAGILFAITGGRPPRGMSMLIEPPGGHGVDVWVYRGADWFVRDPQEPHVARETWTRAARRVTTSNQDEGFAHAVERFVLP
jgi:hydroxymethylpyrimidine pyrophosphatase-like HAD family hydrolase